MIKTYFITGAEGVGKTSVIKILKRELPEMDIHDFDEFIVPENPQLQWRLDTTLNWINKAIENQKKNISTCIIGLSFPDEIINFDESKNLNSINFCLLDVEEFERKKRLSFRNASEEVIDDLEQLHKLREVAEEKNINIIDTSILLVEEVAKEIIKWIKSV